MEILKTQRLRIRELDASDAGFMLQVMNEPAFHEHIGDRGLRTEADALAYMREHYLSSYREHGFGLWHVSRLDEGTPLGMCGLIKRPDLDAPDIGYGFLAAHWGAGYAVEAGRGVLAYARQVLRLSRVVALTAPENLRSIKVLQRLGMQAKGMVHTEGYPAGSLLFES